MEAPTALWRGGRQADRPAGGRQAPPNIKAEPLPSHPHLVVMNETFNVHAQRKRGRHGRGG